MTTVSEATHIVLSTHIALSDVEVPLYQALGRILKEEIKADRDFPPFNRVAMDGVAVNFSQLTKTQTLVVEGVQLAGQPQKELINVNNCLEVMTGAILPGNTDTVIKYEDVIIMEGKPKNAKVIVNPQAKGENIHFKGTDRKEGDLLISSGTKITPSEIAIAATVGKSSLKVSALPRIALVSTGDELIDVGEKPLPHQIRKSNVYALQAALLELGLKSKPFHLNDDRKEIYDQLKMILEEYDVLLLSGGVSMGKADFVPQVLEALNVEKLFHKVAQRPGKPFWFGKTINSKVVFALPGNPISTFFCYYKYVRPWMEKNMGAEVRQPVKAVLAEDITFKSPLTYFLQVKVKVTEDGRLLAKPVTGKGSGDLANLLVTDGFLELPAQESEFKAGTSYDLIPYRQIT